MLMMVNLINSIAMPKIEFLIMLFPYVLWNVNATAMVLFLVSDHRLGGFSVSDDLKFNHSHKSIKTLSSSVLCLSLSILRDWYELMLLGRLSLPNWANNTHSVAALLSGHTGTINRPIYYPKNFTPNVVNLSWNLKLQYRILKSIVDPWTSVTIATEN